jgi:hypothetical protein
LSSGKCQASFPSGLRTDAFAAPALERAPGIHFPRAYRLGVVNAVAFAAVRNLVVLWPLLTPLGSFYASLESGDIEMPWASILGFLDVLALMAAAIWLTVRHQRRGRRRVAVKR